MSKVKMVVVIMTMMVVFIAIVTWPGVVGRCLMQKGLPWTSVTTTRSASPVLSATGSARESAIVETILKILFPDAGCRERHRNAGPTPCLPILLFQTARTPGRRSHQDHFELIWSVFIAGGSSRHRVKPANRQDCSYRWQWLSKVRMELRPYFCQQSFIALKCNLYNLSSHVAQT